MSDGSDSSTGFDPFTKFWSDMMGKMAAGGMTSPPPQPDVSEQMRKAFFGAMAEYADEFMRSEQFLKAMKQGMDNSLALRQQINQMLTRTVEGAQMASSSSTDHIALLVRGMEDRVLKKLDDLEQRVENLESMQNGSSKRTPAQAKSQKRRR